MPRKAETQYKIYKYDGATNLKKEMSPSQVEEAQRLARNWKLTKK
jgi:hypothetical protein